MWHQLFVAPSSLEGAVMAVTPGTVHDPLTFSGAFHLECDIAYNVFVELQGITLERLLTLRQ